MDITKRKITKIARETSKFVSRSLKLEGIGTGEFNVLHAIRKNPGTTQREIADLLGIDKAAIARQTKSLENKGYIERRSNPADGRSQLLYPTEMAETLKNSKARIEATYYEFLTTCLTKKERETFALLLNKLYLKSKEESQAGFVNVSALLESEND